MVGDTGRARVVELNILGLVVVSALGRIEWAGEAGGELRR